ncbi:hypothetical protein [Bauldia sp.]|uniref:hypothetical protein n=1 Tax=Bauldia sp. TaxID=2575872 RepID=UPI003BABB5A6
MHRILTLCGSLGFLTTLALAEEQVPGRYAVEPSFDGFVRLDTETGALSHCRREQGIWRCAILAEDRSAIDALADDVAALATRVDALAARVDAFEASRSAPAQDESSRFFDTLMERLEALVRDIRRPPPDSG